MRIKYSKIFLKNFKIRISSKQSLHKKFDQRIILFAKNPNNPFLKDHALKGSKRGLRSFSITGDIRVIYEIEENFIHFLDIGTHNQVY